MNIVKHVMVSAVLVLFLPVISYAAQERGDVLSVQEWEIAQGDFSYTDAVPPAHAVWLRTDRAVLSNRFGLGRTIWLRVKIPSETEMSSSVHLRNVDQCFTLYLDNVPVYASGTVSNKLSPFDWHLVPLPDGCAGKYLYFKIYSSISSVGVINNTAVFGKSDTILSRIINEDIITFVIGILFVLMGIASICMIWIGISRRAFLSFGVFVIALGIYTVTQGRIKQIVFGHNYDFWGTAELLSLYFVPVGINVLINQIVNPSRKNPYRYLWIISGLFAAAGLLLAFLWPNGLMWCIYPFEIYLLINIAAVIIIIGISSVRGNREASVFGAGIVFLVAFASYDIFQNMYLLMRSRYVSHWGLLLFILCVSGILVTRIVKMYRDAGNNSRKLEYKNIILNQAYQQMEDLHKEIELTQKEVIFRLSEVAEARSKETGNHVRRVAEYCRLLALGSGMPYDLVDILKLAAPMHDIGKLAIPDAILNKPDKLTPEEFELVKGHTLFGYEMLKKSEREIFHAAAIVAWEHHEKFSGGGYPRGIAGEDIHVFGRITAIADVFDSLASDRCYKKAWDMEKVLLLMKEERGRHFDPELIDVLFDTLPKFIEIKDSFKDEIV